MTQWKPVLNAAVRAEMARSAHTQTSLAGALGMSQSALGRRLCGDIDWTVAELVEASRVLGCPLSDLLPAVAA